MHFLSRGRNAFGSGAAGFAQDAARAVQAELASADPQALELTMRRVVASPPRRRGFSGRLFFANRRRTRRRFRAARIHVRANSRRGIRLLFEQFYSDKQRGDQEEIAFETRIEQFWDAMPAREIARALKSQDAWCVPVSALRRHLEPLISRGRKRGAEASGRTARRAIGNYVRCLESEETKARRTVAAALVELSDVLKRLWPHPQLEDLAPEVVAALVRESSPASPGCWWPRTENLARVGGQAPMATRRSKHILKDLDKAPRDAEMGTLMRWRGASCARTVAQSGG